jgi:predicted RNase H-like nuclease
MSKRLQRLAGVDGCKSGWLVVESTPDMRQANWKIVPNWNAIAREAEAECEFVAVDMPIGISGNGVRQCEVDARRVLSPSASRVFKTLPRETLRFAQDEWSTANQWSKSNGMGGLSKQIWNIRPKIIEIDAAITPALQARVHEAHPELAFARLNGGKPLQSKHTPEGLTHRRALLEASGFRQLETWLGQLRGSGAKADDLLDACALVLTARHLLEGTAIMLPGEPEFDARDLRMSIAY